MKQNLTTGSVWKSLIKFSIPFFLSYFLQTLYGMADLFIIGQFNGVESTTAVSIGSQVMHMITVMIVGLAMGGTVLIGQAIGAKDSGKVSKVIGNTISLFLGLSVLVTGILLVFVDSIIEIMSTPIAALSGTKYYVTICFIGIPFVTAYNMISSIFRGMGDSKSPMISVAIACVTNIGLDYLFIGAMDMGPIGAALGTTISQAFSVIISLDIIRRRKMGIKISKENLRLQKDTIGSILKIGVPIALQNGFIQIAFITITIFVNLRGLNDAAAVGIVEKVIGILFLVPSSMMQSVSVLSAQNAGAGKEDRAKKVLFYSCFICIGWGIVMTILMMFLGEEVVGLFTDSEVVERLGGQYMKGYVWDCMVAGIHFSFSGYFCAYGLSTISFIHNVCSILLVRIPGAYVASKFFTQSLFPLGLASPIGSLFSVIICVGVYLWMEKNNKRNNNIRII